MAPLPSSPNSGDPRRSSASAAAGILSSAFRHLPLLPSSKSSVLDRTAPNNPHFALFEAADRCFKALTEAVAGHPLVRSVFSLNSSLQSFCQSHRRSPHIVTLPVAHNFAAVLPGDSVAGLVVANGIINFLNLYNTLLVVRLVLTWFPNSPPAIVSPLSTICDPYLNIFRGLIPPLGGTLDLSPILAFIVLNAFTSTAAALPAELPVTMSQQNSSMQQIPPGLTTTQEKWMRRTSKGPKI